MPRQRRQVRGRGRGRAQDQGGQPGARGENEVVGGLQPAIIDCSESSDDETTSNTRKKPNLVSEGPRYGYKMPSGAFIFKSNCHNPNYNVNSTQFNHNYRVFQKKLPNRF